MEISNELLEALMKKFDERYALRSNPVSASMLTKRKRNVITPLNLDDHDQHLLVSYEEIDEVKKLGAKFDPENKLWYIPSDVEDKVQFSKWRQYTRDGEGNCVREYLEEIVLPTKKRQFKCSLQLEEYGDRYLLVPYDEKETVKKLGAKFDTKAVLWYIPDTFVGDRAVFSKWRKFNMVNNNNGIYTYEQD